MFYTQFKNLIMHPFKSKQGKMNECQNNKYTQRIFALNTILHEYLSVLEENKF